MNQEHYLNYAVWNKIVNHCIEPTLIKVDDGYFASRAWRISDEAYQQVTGTKFGGIFGDDGTESWVSKFDVRRLTSDEEFERLYEASHIYFKVMMKVLDLLDAKQEQMANYQDKYHAYQKIVEFKSYGPRWFANMQIVEMPSDSDLLMIADCVLRHE